MKAMDELLAQDLFAMMLKVLIEKENYDGVAEPEVARSAAKCAIRLARIFAEEAAGE